MKKISILNTQISILLMAFALQACTPEPIDIDIRKPDPKLVLASQIIPNQIMFVSVMKSFSALSGPANGDTVGNTFLNEILVKNAFVTVAYNGKIDTLNMVTPGVYASLNTLQYDYGVYTLYVKDPYTGLVASAVSTILPQVAFDTIYPVIEKGPKDTIINVHSEFTDIPGYENFYVVSYFNKASASNPINIDLNGYFTQGQNQLNDFDIYSDVTFDSPKKVIDKKLEGISATDTIAVVISNISPGYYDFLSAYKRAGQLFNQISGEPITYPSNVVGGYGYFNTHYPFYQIFPLRDY